VVVEDLDEDIGADGHGDTGVEEVAGVDHDGGATAFGFERAKGSEEIIDRTVALEKVHIFDAAEEAVERCREDDDGNVGASAAEEGSHFGSKLARSEMVVEDGNVDFVEELGRLFDGRGGDAVVPVLTQDGGAEMQVCRFVVEKKDTDVSGVRRHGLEGRGAGEVRRFRHLKASMLLGLS
jgi:hypothetical protein